MANDKERPPWEPSDEEVAAELEKLGVSEDVLKATVKQEALEDALTKPTGGCEQCAAYQSMLQLIMAENTELNAKVMEHEIARKLAEEMLPKHIQKFLADQAEAAERLKKAKELAEFEAALPQGLTKPNPKPIFGTETGRYPTRPNIQVPPGTPNTITGGDEGWLMPFGKHRGLPLAQVPTDYMAWCLAQEWLRPEPRQRMKNVIAKRTGRMP